MQGVENSEKVHDDDDLDHSLHESLFASSGNTTSLTLNMNVIDIVSV